MNGVISISLVVVFLIVFSSFFLLSIIFPVENAGMLQNEFFSMEINSKEKLVFLMGSSMVAQLNVTKIDEMVSQFNDEYTVYNVAYNGDTPNKRLLNIDKLISLKPKMVVYGISYDTFGLSYEEKIENNEKDLFLPDPKDVFDELINSNNQKFGPFNPKITSIKFIREFFSFTGLFPPTSANKIYLPNAPFSYFAEYQRVIHTDDVNLERYTTIEDIKGVKIPLENNERVKNFKTIIKKLHDNDIEIVLLIAPLHETYLSHVPKSEYTELYKIIDDVKNEFNLQVYDIQNKYANLPIWMDVTHVAYDKKSMIYSEELAKEIISKITIDN